MSICRHFAAPGLTALVTLLAPARSFAQSCDSSPNWKCGVSYGGNTVMDLYVPTNVDASPGIVVSIHYCSGNSKSAHPWFQSLADKYGFVIIAPGAGGNCFDASPQRSGEREAITKMVNYVVTQNHADPKRVFAAGASSGACMTNALLAAYPEVFAAGSVLAGVPAGAWTGGNTYAWDTPNKSAQQWGDIVRNADKGFSGTRPRVQLWHGTADNTLTYDKNFPAEVAQWTNVLGVGDANAMKADTKPMGATDTWHRTTYKDAGGTVVLETNVADGAPHDLSGRGLWPDVVRFFGLDSDAPAGGSGGAGGGGGAAGAAGAGNAGGGAGGSSSGNGGAATNGGISGAGTASTSGGTQNSAGGFVNAGAPSGGLGSGGISSGGAPASGGLASGASGGALVTSGGAPSSGGSISAGAPSSSGGSSTAGSGGAPPDDGNCGCRVAGGSHDRPLGLLVGFAALAGVLVRRRRRSAS